MNDSGAFQDVESNYSKKISHVASQPTVVPSPRSTLSRNHSLRSATWNLSGTQGNVLWQSTFYVRFITDNLSKNSSLYESKSHRCNPSAGKHGETCRERRGENLEHGCNADVWKKAVNHEFFFTSGNPTEFYGWTAKTTDIGASVR